ncbi:hypothetical protein Cgig2_033279 [Carnegiea gigantea]|uniref:Phosphoglycerate mutase family protein n=1 Tax=Carnegiea gigantea TaxID=171969 RepID=A0A9Q1KVY9_9CARY|nr:hypothetical protein Cgig2_033279 [Carnegiea gigantea]
MSSGFDQNVIVMRHGDRRDNFDPSWARTAERPWDPPLIDAGLSRAFRTGRELRRQLGFPIHRVFVSPFLRCVQTASEVVSALCATVDDDEHTGGSVPIDPSKIKVSIEYGLCEMLSREAIRPELAPTDGDFRFNISELEAMLPPGTVDHAAERIYPEVSFLDSVSFCSTSLMPLLRGEGVGVSVGTFLKGAVAYEVNYCAYSHARRSITFGENKSFSAGNFQLLTVPEKAGIRYYTNSSLSDGL